MQPEQQHSTASQMTPRSRKDILEHFRLGAVIGLMGFAIVAFSSVVMPMEHPDLTTLAIWGVSLPLGTGIFAAALGEWGIALVGGIMTFLG